MAVGTSGRIVIDVDPALKRRLHSALQQEAKSLKDWFLERCQEYLADRQQPKLFDQGVRHSGMREAGGQGL